MVRQIEITQPLSFLKRYLNLAASSVFFVLVFTNFVWAIWVDADGTGTESRNVSNSSAASYWPSLCLDSSVNPHISWSEAASRSQEVFHLKWNGSSWVDADCSGQESMNISNTSGSSYVPSLCLDTSGNPHIAWQDNSSGNYEIYYLKWNGSSWVDADGLGQESINVSNTSGVSYSCSLCLDASGNPHVAWWDGVSGNYEIYYLKWNGIAWVDADGLGQESINVSNTTGESFDPSLCLDTSGNPHIAWSDTTSGNSEIYYLKWDGSSWVDADGSGRESINISNTNDSSGLPSLCIDNSGNPYIAWLDYISGVGDIYYLKWDGSSWVDADGSGRESINVSNTSGGSYWPSLCLDRWVNPHIAWSDYTLGNWDICYLKWDGSSWVDADGSGGESINVSNTSSTSRWPSLCLDTSQNPHIAWSEDKSPGIGEIYYLKWVGADYDLLKKYAPILYLHPDEPIYPWGIYSMLDKAELWELKSEGASREHVASAPITVKQLDDNNTSSHYLDLRDYAVYGLEKPTKGVWENDERYRKRYFVYGRYYEPPEHDDKIVLQYWIFCPFNDSTNNHEGDWEMAQIVLDKKTKNAQKLCCGFHWDGRQHSWNSVSYQNIDTTHPKVFIAKGGHGCWATSGIHRPSLLIIDETSERGTALYPHDANPDLIKGTQGKEPYTLIPISHEPSWVNWLGKWGDAYLTPLGSKGPNSPVFIDYRYPGAEKFLRWSEPIEWGDSLKEGEGPSYSQYILYAIAPKTGIALHAFLKTVELLTSHAYEGSELHVGETETGEIEANIPGTYFYVPSYYSDDQKEWMWIYASESLRFELKARPTTSESSHVKGGSEEISNLSFKTYQGETAGKFSFAFNRYLKEKDQDVTVRYYNVQFAKDTTATVDVSPENPGYLMEIDLDGDGIIDQIQEPTTIEGISRLDSVIVYPNPCYLNKGQKVKITSLPLASKIHIYTITGELVKTLEEDSGKATWDCRNETGQQVSRGIYIYMIVSNIGRKTGKMAIIK